MTLLLLTGLSDCDLALIDPARETAISYEIVVQGVVVEARTGLPVPLAAVDVSLRYDREENIELETDEEGRFQFEDGISYTDSCNSFGCEVGCYVKIDVIAEVHHESSATLSCAGLTRDSPPVYMNVLPVNNPPPVPTMIAPGAVFSMVIQGDPATPFGVTWTAVSDIEGDPVSYSWHLASDANFADTLFFIGSIDTTGVRTTYGQLAALLSATGAGQNEVKALYHRVSASDPDTTAHGTTQTILLTRGALTGLGGEQVPGSFEVNGAFPNPCASTVSIEVALPIPENVEITMHDIIGREVLRSDLRLEAGRSVVPIDVSGFSPGVYQYSVRAGDWQKAGAVVVAR